MGNLQSSNVLPKVRIGEIATKVGSGATPRGGKESYKADGISLIRSMNVYDLKFHYTDLAFIDEKQAKLLDNVTVKKDDVLVNITGASVARCCIVPDKILPARVNQHVAIIRLDKTKANPYFLQYCLVSTLYKDHLLSIAQGGSTREALTKEKIEEFRIPFLNLSMQCKIATILSAYDGLIENNSRRIKILEEMAQNLYREWFINFRFPGHERTRFVDSPLGRIPDEWEVTTVENAFAILGGGTPSKKVDEYWNNGEINWYTPSDLTATKSMFMDESSNKITELGLKKSSAKLFPPFSVMMTSRATLGVISININEACTNQGFITCIPNDKFPLYKLYHWLKENVEKFINHASGATFKEISKGVFKTLEIIVPHREVTIRFEDVLRPMGLQISNLQRKNYTLRQTRDLLLPKLISGEVDVSKIDINVMEEEVV